MSYKQVLIDAAEGEPMPVLDYMAMRNRQWLTEWYIRRARYHAALEQHAKNTTPKPDTPTT